MLGTHPRGFFGLLTCTNRRLGAALFGTLLAKVNMRQPRAAAYAPPAPCGRREADYFVGTRVLAIRVMT
jgi:hypothetical protein